MARTSGSRSSWRASSISVLSANASEVVTSTTAESVPCSASMSRSAARRIGSALLSASTTLSVGPSSIIVATPWRCISTCAQVTAGEPGPTTLRTFGKVSVPKPSAAIPAGPFARNTLLMPSLRHTTNTAASTSPSLPGTGGTTSAISGTPATVAGTASWYATDG